MASQESMTASQEPETTSQEPKMISQESKGASQEPTVTSPEPKMISQGSKSASQEPNTSSQEPNTSSQEPVTTTSSNPSSKYSNRVVLKTILEPSDKWREFVDERVVVGGWVKSSKEMKPAVPEPQQQTTEAPNVSPGHKDVRCVEIFQSRIPIFRSIAKIFGGGGSSHPVREKPEPAIPEPPRSSVAYLLVSDGSSVASLRVYMLLSLFPLDSESEALEGFISLH